MSNQNQLTGNTLTCEVTMDRIMCERTSKHNASKWYIVTANVQSVIEGDPKIHPLYGTITLIGNLPTFNQTDTYKIVAQEEYNEQYQRYQYQVIYFSKPMNLTNDNEKKIFLKNVLTEQQLNNFYDVFDDPLSIIDSADINQMIRVKGVGKKTATSILKKYLQGIDYSSIYVELDRYGLTKKMIENLVKQYKSPQVVISKIKENPYFLADEMHGIGWTKADDIALRGGIEYDSPFRIKSFILHILESEAKKGNSYVDPQDLTSQIYVDLGHIDNEKLVPVIQDMYNKEILWRNNSNNNLPTTRVGLMKYFHLENNIAQELKRINEGANKFKYDKWEDIITQVEKEQGWKYTDEQKEGIYTVLKNQVTFITGGGGTGKTSTVNGIIKVLSTYRFSQCALSGKASARMSEVTGKKGTTIHRLLEFDPSNWENMFNRTKKNPLESHIVLLDELSMVDGYLFYSLIQAVPTGSKLILLGDVSQLESMGCMNLAKDILESKYVTTIELTKIHRQAQKSGIITESVKLRQENPIPLYKKGWMGHEFRGELRDFELDVYQDRYMSASKVLESFKYYLLKATDITEIQVLVPIKERGGACVFNINNAIQDIYNPRHDGLKEVEVSLNKDKKFIIRENDKIMVMKNNYKTKDILDNKTPIFNGQQGIVKKIDTHNNLIYVHMPFVSNELIVIPKKAWGSLNLGYASTIAKSQGSQYEYVIGCIDYSTPPNMLTKELVYTLITRASKLCKLCGETNALYKAMTTSFVSTKKTFLKQLLDDEVDDI